MLVWLASYPRSGNTLMRILINRSFGVPTYSLYDDQYEGASDEAFQRVVAHRRHGIAPEEFVLKAQASPRLVLAKTHEFASGIDKAVYVVRDGRASLVSHWHYLRDIDRVENISLERVIDGAVWPGSWSKHAESWLFSNRPNTLAVRYEDLASEPLREMQRIAEFVGLPAPKPVSLDFASLHAEFPKFFRKGSNAANLSEFDESLTARFFDRHGETMRRLGYLP